MAFEFPNQGTLTGVMQYISTHWGHPLRRFASMILENEASGSLEVGAAADGGPFNDGDMREYEVDHSIGSGAAVEVEFHDTPMPRFADAAGFTVTPVLSGTNGGKFRVLVTYDAEEYVYNHGAEPGTGGTATLPWTRRGIRLPQW